MKSTDIFPDRLLRRHYRWMRVAWPLTILAAGLSSTLLMGWWRHPSWTRVEKWDGLAVWWASGVAFAFIAAMGVWLWRRRSLLHSAQSLDARLAAKNRLETTVALQHDAGALARAQREETAGFLHQAPVRPPRTPLPALATLVVLLTLAHLVTLLSWTRPWIRPAKTVAAHRTPPPAAIPRASIKWKSPEAETKAAPVEEVPLEAVADSTGGLRDLVLDISVNGELRQSVPVVPVDLKKAGTHTIQTSIYLDQLAVEPFDIVSYDLRAQRIDPRKLPETVSPVQFVQVKPFRDDVREMPGGDSKSAFPLIVALKAAQLRLMKENFLLAHTDLTPDNEVWKKENTHVGGEQGVLEQKTGEVIQKLIEGGLPAEIIDLLSQARPLMATAAEKIRATQNQPALAPQGKALGYITEVEKFFVKMAARDGSARGSKSVSDPFHDKKQIEMKQRFKTQAGELELLAKEQARLADDLARPDAPPPPAPAAAPSPADATPGPNKIEGTPAERQTQISQRIGALLNGTVFVPDVTRHLEQGRDKARESLQQLDEGDVPAAREPAASTARELRLAVDAMNKAAEDDAKDQLANALRELNNAVDAARNAPQQGSNEAAKQKAGESAKKAGDTARKLAEAAQKQQETGSEKAAARLNELAKALSSEDMKKALDRLREQPRNAARAQDAAGRLQQIADRAAQPRGDSLSPEQIARLIDRMARARANMERLAMNGNNHVPSREEQDGRQGENSTASNQSKNGSEGTRGNGTGTEGRNSADKPAMSQSGGLGALAPEKREQFAHELIEDVRDAVEEAAVALPKSEELAQVRDTVRDVATEKRNGSLTVLFPKMDPPLQGVINQLRAELARQQRQHQLTDHNPDQAPSAYRSAVADYFEQLSRDYKAAPTPAPEAATK